MNRTWQILIGVLIVLILATYLVLEQPGESSVSGSSGEMLVAYDSTAVDRLEIQTPSELVRLEKEAGKWMITAPLRYTADENAVTSAVGKGRSLELTTTPVSTNPEKQHLFLVDSAGTLVNVFERENLVAAFRVGKPSTTFTETYVRKEGSDEVYLTEGVLSSVFNRVVNDWRDKTVFKADQNLLKRVSFQYGDTSFALTLQDSIWMIGNQTATESTVKACLSSLCALQGDEFVDTAVAALPKLTAAVEAEGAQIRFYHMKDSDKYYVQSSRSPQWFILQSWKASQILKRKSDFVPKPS